jgi:hypothetical protein
MNADEPGSKLLNGPALRTRPNWSCIRRLPHRGASERLLPRFRPQFPTVFFRPLAAAQLTSNPKAAPSGKRNCGFRVRIGVDGLVPMQKYQSV